MAKAVFISHSSADKRVADRLCNQLEAADVECWIAPRDITPGAVWASEIVRGIQSSDLFVLLASRKSLASTQVERELERAVAFDRGLLAIRLDDCPLPESFEYFLESRHWVAWEEGNWDVPVQAVFQALGRPVPDVVRRPALWELLDRAPLVIVGSRWKEQFQRWERSGLVGYGDTRALIELRGGMERIGISNVALRFEDNLHHDDSQANLVLVGGPDVNRLSKRFLQANSATTFHWASPDTHRVSIVDEVSGAEYIPSLGNDATVGTDYGLVIRAVNPDNESRHALLLAGSFGFGTWACAIMSFLPSLNSHRVVAAHHAFEALVQVDVEHESPAEIRLVDLRVLASA